MKNQLKSIAVTLSFFCLFLMTNCKKKDSVLPGVGFAACGANVEKLTNASNAYLNAATKANCEKYKDEVRAFFKSCPAFYTGTSKKDLEEALSEPCPN